eukprot:3124630-Pyramimonas_sp.AAC.1
MNATKTNIIIFIDITITIPITLFIAITTISNPHVEQRRARRAEGQWRRGDTDEEQKGRGGRCAMGERPAGMSRSVSTHLRPQYHAKP